MRRRNTRGARMLAPLAAAFTIGILAGWLLKAWGPPQPRELPRLDAPAAESVREPLPLERESRPATLEARPLPIMPSSTDKGDAIEMLRRRRLRLPIDGVKFESLKGNFTEKRSGDGGHVHEAVDMLAP